MDHADACRAINRRWLTEWPTMSGGVSFVTDNNSIPVGSITTYLARFSIITLDSEQRTIGPRAKAGKSARRSWQHFGIIDVRLEGPIDVGTDQLNIYGQMVRTLFQGVRFGNGPRDHGITTEATAIGQPIKQPNKWVLVCSTPFDYVERG
jgi:hypothetical protein